MSELDCHHREPFGRRSDHQILLNNHSRELYFVIPSQFHVRATRRDHGLTTPPDISTTPLEHLAPILYSVKYYFTFSSLACITVLLSDAA